MNSADEMLDFTVAMLRLRGEMPHSRLTDTLAKRHEHTDTLFSRRISVLARLRKRDTHTTARCGARA